MELLLEAYRAAQHDEEVARLRRLISLRAMIASGMSQRQVADALGLSQPAVSQQMKTSSRLVEVHPETLIEAASPVLKALLQERGYTRPAIFGSVARRQARRDSDIDLLVQPPPGTSSFAFVELERVIEKTLGRPVDLVSYGGLTPGLDDDIRRETVAL